MLVTVLVALLPPVVLIAVGLGIWALVRHPRLLRPAVWIVTIVVLILIALGLTVAGPVSELHRFIAVAPALEFLVVLWLVVALTRRRGSP